MKAALLKNWGDLEIVDIKKPEIAENEALLHVIYGGVCGSDITVYHGQHPTAVVPVVPCHEILGVIDELPEGYTGQFKVGDRVVPNPVISCGVCYTCKTDCENVCANLKLLGIHKNGGFAEYTTAKIDRLVNVDENLPNEIAVLGEPFAVGYHVNKRSGIKKGDKMLVIGAGTIGIIVALVAYEFGAQRVLISEINTERLALAASLGIETINPKQQDLIASMKEITDGIGFDAVCDASGSKEGSLILPDLCRARGVLVSLNLSGKPYEFSIGKVSFKEMTLIGSRLYSQEDFKNGIKLMNTLANKYSIGSLVTDIMPLSQTMQAIEKMINTQNVGKIIISGADE